tara:strand:+ start:729 stop:863 length:135 start_codon:yes stop_codon:yes gene_type:complete
MTRDSQIKNYLMNLEKDAIVNLIIQSSSDKYLNELRGWIETQYY